MKPDWVQMSEYMQQLRQLARRAAVHQRLPLTGSELELPQTVDLEIIETAPGIKGASASSRTKPATMSTGLVIQVPEYLTTGEKIRIHIEECRYMGRAD